MGKRQLLTDKLLPIGHIQTPYTQKFGIPRQGVSVGSAKGTIVFAQHIHAIEACAGIMQFSHLWLIFQFHQNVQKPQSFKVRPPRLGGNARTGVFASRSSFRPNGLGMSVVRLLEFKDNTLVVEGVDMLSGTPIIDIKPYIAYADCVPDAVSGYAENLPSRPLSVDYSAIASAQLKHFAMVYPDLYELLEATLTSDPRPAYKKNKHDEKQYHIRLYDIDIGFIVKDTTAKVMTIEQVKS